MNTTHIKWVLAHEPIEIFIRAAQRFAEVVDQHLPGQVEIEILTLSEYSNKYNNGVLITKHELLDLMEANKIEMSQMYTYVLSKFNPDLNALDMPFIFENHEHAARVFEGPIGQDLLDGYRRNSNIHGMAFTYSGGFKNMPFGKEVQSLSDLSGARVRVSNSPVCQATFRSVGADPVVMEIEDLPTGLADGSVQGGESAWPRFFSAEQNKVSKAVFETNHSLLLTNIIINSKFFAGLSQELQDVMSLAAVEAARFERAISVAEVKPSTERAQNEGIKVVYLSDEDRTKFKQLTSTVYEQFKDTFTPGLIDKIKKA
jgi:TRAP-type transport system periplasmic protein